MNLRLAGFCFVILSIVACAVNRSGTVRASPPIDDDTRMAYRESAKASGAVVLSDLETIAVILPIEAYLDVYESKRAAAKLMRRHPTVGENLNFWQPTEEEARLGFHAVIASARHRLEKRLLEKPSELACQIFGIEDKGRRGIVYNFVLSRRQDDLSFYVRPDDFHNLYWPFGGTVLVDEAGQVVSWARKLPSDSN